MLVACVTALGAVTGVWPVLELHRLRVSLRLAAEPAAGTREHSAWRELEGWARKLGGELVSAGPVT